AYHLLLGGLGLLALAGGGLEVPVSGDDLGQRLVHAHGVADPGDLTVLPDHEGGRDAVLVGGRHPGLGPLALVPLLPLGDDVEGDAVVHLVAHLLDEWLDAVLGLLTDAHADERDALVLVLLLELGQVRDADAARPAPGRPELDDVELAGLE